MFYVEIFETLVDFCFFFCNHVDKQSLNIIEIFLNKQEITVKKRNLHLITNIQRKLAIHQPYIVDSFNN